MDRIQVLPIKTVPRWALIGLITIGLILAGVILIFITSRLSPNDPFVNLIFINGEVAVSDGYTDTAAITGPLTARNVHILLKTGEGTAGLQLPDGSSVIIDSDSTIEFMQKNDYDPHQTFAFNLIKGRVVVVSEKVNQTPTQILLGGTEVVEVSQAAVGLITTDDNKARGRVDCLEGECLVNGVYLLKSGQNAQLETNNNVEVTDGILMDTWILLSKATQTNLAVSNRFERILSALTNSVIPTGSTVVANQVIPITGFKIPSATSSLTLTLWLTGTATPTPTISFWRGVFPSPSSTEINGLPPPATLTPVWTFTPTPTFTPSNTPTTGITVPPTSTTVPTQTNTFTITPTATPSPTPGPTSTPKPTPTPKPTHTPKNPPTNTPTNTVEPSPTATFTVTPIPTNPV
jgi:hypothetical protein